METDCIHYKDTGYFSNIIIDYLDEAEKLKPFYEYSPQISSFDQLIQQKILQKEERSILRASIIKQYTASKINLDKSEAVKSNIHSLSSQNCFTVCTGHQLCLFSGPLYFIYKIASAITLAKKLTERYPDKTFVPVYWMATEDHDFEEINHFRFKGERIQWETKQEGAVGRMHLKEVTPAYKHFSSLLSDYGLHAEQLRQLFDKAYLTASTLADATRILVHELFSSYGVVVIDGDDTALKRLFIPTIKKELQEVFSSKEVEEQSNKLAAHYKIQVNSREINLFYLQEGSRARIVKEGNTYFVNETALSFSEKEILEELENHPERFSPNVLLRPLYQETILPNLAYIGGGGE